MPSRLAFVIVLIGACAFACARVSLAQEFSSRPISVMVPVPPGGSLDWVARYVAAEAVKRGSPQMVVENRPGGGGVIAMQVVTRAAPDGRAMLVFANTQAALPVFAKNLPVDPENELVGVTTIDYAPYVISTSTRLPVSSLSELIAYAKANPGKLNFALTALNTTTQLMAEEFKKRTGTSMLIVPYNGIAPAMTAVLAGDAQLWVTSPFGLEGYVKDGKLRILAVADTKPFPLLPDVPTYKAAMGAGDDMVYLGVCTVQVKAGTPRPAIDRLAGIISAVVRSPEAEENLRKIGFEPLATTPSEAQELIAREYRRAREVAQAVGIKPE